MPILFDCGANLGQGFEILKSKFNINPYWIVYMIEPNANCAVKLSRAYPGNCIINAALAKKEGKQFFNLCYCQKEKDWVGGESNILEKGYEGWERYFKYSDDGSTNYFNMQDHLVNCITLSSLINMVNVWQSKNMKNEDIYIKLDIEGSEFDVLEEIIENCSLDNVRYVTVEWHDRFFNSRDFHHRKNAIIEQLRKIPNLKYEEWH